MKTAGIIAGSLLIGSGILLSPTALGQPQGGPAKFRAEQRADGGKNRQGKFNGRNQMAERYLRHLKEKNPEEHERLSGLRESDPEAFREAMREKVMQHRRMAEESGQERAPRGMKNSERRNPGDKRKGSIGDPEQAQKIRGLVHQIRQSSDEESRGNLTTELQAELSKAFDQRMAARQERIQAAKDELHRLIEATKAEEQNKDAWIERVIGHMISGDGHKKPPLPRE